MAKPGDIVRYSSGNIGIVTANNTVVRIKSIAKENLLIEDETLKGVTKEPPLFNLVELIDKILLANESTI